MEFSLHTFQTVLGAFCDYLPALSLRRHLLKRENSRDLNLSRYDNIYCNQQNTTDTNKVKVKIKMTCDSENQIVI